LCILGVTTAQYTTDPYSTTDAYDYGNRMTRDLRRLFGVGHWEDIKDTVTKVDNETFVFNENVNEFLVERVIPELCNMTADKINLFNSYFLDRQCLEELNRVGPECRAFKCKLAHYVKDRLPRVIYNLFDRDSEFGTLTEAAEFLGKELSNLFKELDMCTCGKKFLKAASNCLPFYFTNALFEMNGEDPDLIVASEVLLRHVDMEATGKVATLLIDHLCEKTDSGMCINSIATVAGRVGELWENTFVYDLYDYWSLIWNGADEKFLIEVWEKCDTFFNILTNIAMIDHPVEDGYEGQFKDFALYTNGFFCDEYCQQKRGIFYPCCMKDLLRDKKMWDNLQKVVESYVRIYEMINTIYGRGYVSSQYLPVENRPGPGGPEFEKEIKKRGKRIRKAFLRWIDAAKTCKDGEVQCIDF
jgi:hypothetical protein